MAHYAILNNNNIVSRVIVGKNENENNIDWELYYSQICGAPCKRTSYNTRGGIHRKGEVPFRKNYAGIGYTYDAIRDAFIPPKPFPSWILDEESCLWKSPIPRPESGVYKWDEQSQNWV